MPRGGGGGVPRSAKEANNPILLKVQSLQLSFRPAGVSLGGGGGAKAPPGPPLRTPLCFISALITRPWSMCNLYQPAVLLTVSRPADARGGRLVAAFVSAL